MGQGHPGRGERSHHGVDHIVAGNVAPLRCGEGGELEIRRMAVAVLRVMKDEVPGLFADFAIYAAPDRHEAARIVYHKV